MFYYKEYTNFFVHIHLNNKLKFYTYKYFSSLKSIFILIKFISIRYSVFNNNVFNRFLLVKNNLFFYTVTNKYFSFTHHNIDYDIFNVFINKNDLSKFNIFYYFFIGTISNTFLNKKLMERSLHINNSYNLIRINFNKFNKSPSNGIFYDIKTFNSFISIFLKTNSNNYNINKLFISHVFLNI